jgi:GNAT superfamily N-acetyltransferase
MEIQVRETTVGEILPLRDLYRQEMNCQIIHDSLHRRGFNDSYTILVDGRIAGYGTATSGKDEHRVFQRGILNEFYLIPAYRAGAAAVFRRLLAVSQAVRIMAQTNDRLLSLMLYDFATGIDGEAVLFEDAFATKLAIPEGLLRKTAELGAKDDWLLETNGTVVATGGFLTHYNPPYGDIYMSVAEPHRRRGYGSYLVQELKRMCYDAGCKPSARCNPENLASRATLQKAGFLPCGRILTGVVRGDAL